MNMIRSLQIDQSGKRISGVKELQERIRENLI